MTEYKKGTVVLVFFPNSDLITAKHRPAVIVQAETQSPNAKRR
jgi:hypothetical protein